MVLPLIVPGVAGIDKLTKTGSVRAEEAPQLLFDVTVIFPLAVPAVVLIEVVVEEPVHPAGKIHA